MVAITQGSEGEPQVDSFYYFIIIFFLLLSFSRPIINPAPQPHTHTYPLESHYAKLASWFEAGNVGVHTLERFTCGVWSNLANWWASKTWTWCRGPNIFSSDALALRLSPSLSVAFLYSQHSNEPQAKVTTFCELHGVSHPSIVILLLLPRTSLYLPPLCPSLWLNIYVLSHWSWSAERSEDVSWAWTEASISSTSKTPTPPPLEVSVASGDAVFTRSSSYTVIGFNLSFRSFTDGADTSAAAREPVSCTHGWFLFCSFILLLSVSCCLEAQIWKLDCTSLSLIAFQLTSWEVTVLRNSLRRAFNISHSSFLIKYTAALFFFLLSSSRPKTNTDRWHISLQVRFMLMVGPRRWRSPLTQTPAVDCLHLGPVKVINDDRSGPTVNSVQSVWWMAGSRCGLSQVWYV